LLSVARAGGVLVLDTRMQRDRVVERRHFDLKRRRLGSTNATDRLSWWAANWSAGAAHAWS
jgi:hypothetical protein